MLIWAEGHRRFAKQSQEVLLIHWVVSNPGTKPRLAGERRLGPCDEQWKMRHARRCQSKGEHITVDWVAVGCRIREMRGFDMTQGEFAERIGISQNYLSMMERGKVEIGAEILLRIRREFGKSVQN